jgi:hypothetical protein
MGSRRKFVLLLKRYKRLNRPHLLKSRCRRANAGRVAAGFERRHHWVAAPQDISRFAEMDNRAELAPLLRSPSTISSAGAVIE